MAKTGKGKSKKKVKAKPKEKKEVKKRAEVGEDIRGIVRLAENDLDGYMKLERALLQIRGIGHSLSKYLSNVIEERFGIDRNTLIGKLSDEQLETINNFLFNIDSSVLPSYLLNKRKDFYTGEDKHYIMNELSFSERQDIERKIRNRTWQGYRHSRGKKVRGQRTKNTGRRGLTVGVIRKK